MGWQSINAAFATVRATRDVTLAAASLLVALAYHRNDMTGECFPSYDTLMSETRMALKTLRSALRLLEELGLVSYVRERVGAKTIYTLHIGTVQKDTVQKDTVQKDTGKGAVLPGYREQICPPNREINKELNKEGENPLPPPSPAAKREAQTHLFSLSEIPDASKEKTRTHQAFKPPELGVELTESAFRDWMTVRKAKHSPLTETAWKHFKAQVLRSELSIQQAVELCATKGWISINAEWQAVKDYQAEFDSRSSNDRKVDFVIKALGLTDNRKETEK